MIGNIVRGTMFALAGTFFVGVAESTYRHYYRRYADEEDLRQSGPIQEVVIVKDETKKTRGKKK